jgi:methyl-accepting chemotaxis protein
MKTGKSRRRAFAVTSSLQYKFFANSIIYSFIIVCFFAVVIFAPDMVQMRDQSLALEVRGLAASRVLTKHSWVWPTVISLIIVLGVHSFWTFKKVIGPLYRFRWAFKQVENGKLRFSVKTRQKDYLQTEEEALNSMIKALGERLGHVKEATEGAVKSVVELEQTVNNEDNKVQIDLLRTHRGHLERLASAVQFFRLEEDEKTEIPEQDA